MAIRVVTGIVGIALAAFIIQTGGVVYSAAVLLLMLIGWHEYAKAFSSFGKPLAYFTGMLAMLSFWACAWKGNADEFMALSTFWILWTLLQAVFFHRSFSVEQACYSVAGIVYLGFSFSHLILLRFFDTGEMMSTPVGNMDAGCAWLWIALIGTWASDSFAYFAGCTMGHVKLCEAISPKKTVEGLIGGVVGTMASVAALGYALSLPIVYMAVLGFFIALVATVGDLVESAMKRYTGIKDSGNIIPGHGGVWDRFDSVLFVVPFVYYFVQVFTFLNR